MGKNVFPKKLGIIKYEGEDLEVDISNSRFSPRYASVINEAL